MSEHYVAYFMTAGTKPAQKPNGYCPHSVSPNGEEPYPYEQAPADVDPEVSDLPCNLRREGGKSLVVGG